MILGLKKLFRWAALLMTTSRDGWPTGRRPDRRGARTPDGAAGGRIAAPEECDNAFVVRVFSLLDTMLNVPMEKALESVALPPAAGDRPCCTAPACSRRSWS